MCTFAAERVAPTRPTTTRWAPGACQRRRPHHRTRPRATGTTITATTIGTTIAPKEVKGHKHHTYACF